MTIKELIKELKKFNPDYTIKFGYISSDEDDEYNNEEDISYIVNEGEEVILK